MKKDRKENIKAIIAICIFYLLMGRIGIGCPIRFFTGIPCFGCGMTRALFSLLKLDFSTAFHFHPLFFLPIPYIILLLFKDKISIKIFRNISIFLASIFILVYFMRLLDPNDSIIKIHIKEGFIYRIFRYLKIK